MKPRDLARAQAWCLVRIDERPFAVALNAVAEIVEAEALVRLALCPPRVLGLCAYRRDLLPVIALFDRPTAPRPPGKGDERALILILHGAHGSWGIRIDRGGADVAEGTLEERGAIPDGDRGPIIIGSITRAGTTHAVIDTEATWRNVRHELDLWYKGDLASVRPEGA